MLGNFDLADQAYTKLSDSHQHTPRFLNNLGYSHMLRGELLVAREYFVKVFAVDPDNARAQSNLEMLKNLVSDDQNNGQD
jgi:Flp pilus assembly protein TadD